MTFRDALKTKDFVVTANVNLGSAPSAQSVIEQGEILRPAVDAVRSTANGRQCLDTEAEGPMEQYLGSAIFGVSAKIHTAISLA